MRKRRDREFGERLSSEKGKWKEGERKRAQRGWGEERKESRVREQIKERGKLGQMRGWRREGGWVEGGVGGRVIGMRGNREREKGESVGERGLGKRQERKVRGEQER